jgi:rare lipoprotein A
MRSLICAYFCVLLLTGCEGPASVDQGQARPQGETKSFTRGNKSPYQVFGKTYEVLPTSVDYREIGIASWYGKKFHGRLTSNGEVYDMHKVSAAHKSLPLPTTVKVTNLDNGNSVIVRVNDRGPFHEDRVIDLSYAAAVKLGFAHHGTAPVVVEALTEVRKTPQSTSVVTLADDKPSYYLQVGAFSQIKGAEKLQQEIVNLISSRQLETVSVKILPSETQSTLLHKVWLGPIVSEQRRDQIAKWVQQADLGNPIRVEVE